MTPVSPSCVGIQRGDDFRHNTILTYIDLTDDPLQYHDITGEIVIESPIRSLFVTPVVAGPIVVGAGPSRLPEIRFLPSARVPTPRDRTGPELDIDCTIF